MPITSATAAPAPQLAAATRIVERDDGTLQVGIRPETSIRVSPSAAALATLTDLARGERDDVLDESLLAALDDAGLLAPAHHTAPLAVRVIGSLASDIDALLAWSGVRGRTRGRLSLAISIGEVDRAKLDPLVRADAPHLIVRALDGVVIIGPFVMPGQTACLRCVDAHYADDDPNYLTALDRYILATSQPREDGCLDRPDPSALTLALTWAARDLRTFAAGEVPTTWSSTVVLGRGADPIEVVTWKPHPACGCRWMNAAHQVA